MIIFSNLSPKSKKTLWGIVIFIIVIICIVTILLVALNNNKDNTNNENNMETNVINTYTEVINDIKWSIKYDLTNETIISITSNYSEIDKSSKYWQEITRMHGDSSLWLTYRVSLNGIPLEDDWYRIEKQETYLFGEEIIASRTIRYEEKLIFSTLPNSSSIC